MLTRQWMNFLKNYANKPSPYGVVFYLNAICPHIEKEIRDLYNVITKYYGFYKYKYTIHQLYEKLKNGGDIYEND